MERVSFESEGERRFMMHGESGDDDDDDDKQPVTQRMTLQML